MQFVGEIVSDIDERDVLKSILIYTKNDGQSL